ncbi:hypothetical protein [Pseudomonas knackmussii]|uniref:hypothetical protein n=1 Tax=Pseudomonas knackmussii TaxID=65741 RepID=UPI003F4A2401
MPLQNRVDPTGQLHAIAARGTLMGNRGKLHDNQRLITHHWKLKRWITCALEYQGIKRELMAPNSYTELFFLDEPTSYAAGHRPCGDCRKDRYKAFKAAWARVFPEQDQSAEAIDRILHAARLNPNGTQRTWQARLDTLPDATLVEQNGTPLLLWKGRQWNWSFAGYSPVDNPLPAEQSVTVLTPEPIVRLFAAGLIEGMLVHDSVTA